VSKRVPSLKPVRIIRTLVKLGFTIQNQTGSHVRLKHSATERTLTIARHDRFEICYAVTQKILRQGAISEDDFLDSL
jgi:predicted RNA binding protein YcfA (HicA-like mRNA interferase family)